MVFKRFLVFNNLCNVGDYLLYEFSAEDFERFKKIFWGAYVSTSFLAG